MAVYLTFNMNSQAYALPVEAVESVLELPEVTSLPGGGEMKGVFNLRGAAVPLIDLKEVLGLGATDLESSPSVVVLSLSGEGGIPRLVGALADAVNEVTEFSEAELVRGGLGEEATKYVAGLARRGDSFVVCLDPAAIASRSQG